MQFAVITGPTFETARRRIKQADQCKDGLELRLDLFKEILDLEKLKEALSLSTKKVIITLRKRNQGGGFIGPEKNRQKILLNLLECKPNYIDLEYDTDPDFISEVRLLYPSCRIITSFHNFSLTPRDLEKVFQSMLSEHAYAYKICTTANSFSDAYKMLRFIQKKTALGINFIGLCMGEYGRITRREGIKAGNYLNYTILHNRDNCARGLHLA